MIYKSGRHCSSSFSSVLTALISKPSTSVRILPPPFSTTYRTSAMLKPSTFSVALIIALCGCSKSDHVAANTTPAPAENALQPAIAPTKNDPHDAARIPASEPKQSAKKVAAETGAKEKPRVNPADDRAKRSRSLTARRWEKFQAAMKRCAAVALSAREPCLAEARDAYRSANFDCTALPGRERKECLKYAKLWEDTETDVPKAAVTQDEEPAAVPGAPNDADPGTRNRDSAKPQQDTVGNLPEPTRRN